MPKAWILIFLAYYKISDLEILFILPYFVYYVNTFLQLPDIVQSQTEFVCFRANIAAFCGYGVGM
ncbi:hypothetical protein C6495_17240 [Candidatus Poribacteria bacterium]|nr:MAG: hypothetical protein C6495_17240 [Candidatus Poribacteria bacterium]